MRMIQRSETFLCVLLLGLVDVFVTGQSECQLAFPEMTSGSEETHANVTESLNQNCDIYSNILGMMEELNIISIKKSSCYSMRWISRQVASKSPSDRSRGITVSFQIEEHFDSNLKTDSGSGQESLSEEKSAGSVTTTICHSSGVRSGFTGQQSLAMVHVNNTGENGSNSNATGILLGTNNVNNKKEHGLSHTQVVVIATCSAVIGTFFIVAAVLRIRNYMKRWREQQVVAPPDYHPCLGQPPRGPQKETQEIVSRESSTKKTASRQSSSTVKGGNRYYPVNSHDAPSSPTMSPKHCFLESNPVLVVTAPSPIPTSPSDSHASIQFIDEEADKDVSPQPCHQAEVPVETDVPPVKSHSPVSVDSISSEGEVCNEDMPNQQVAAPVKTAPTAPTAPLATAPVVAAPILAIEAPHGVEQEKLLGNRSDSVNENTVVPNQDAMMSFDTSPTDVSSTPSDVEMVSPELLFVTAGLTQSDESLSCSHNASYSYGNQVEYSNSLYNMEDDCYYDNEVDMDTCSTTPDEELKHNGSSVTSETGNMISNGLTSDDPSSSLSSPPSSPLSDNTAQTCHNNTHNNMDSCGNLINMTSYPDNVVRPQSLNSDTQTSTDITDNELIQSRVHSQMNSAGNGTVTTDNRTCET